MIERLPSNLLECYLLPLLDHDETTLLALRQTCTRLHRAISLVGRQPVIHHPEPTDNETQPVQGPAVLLLVQPNLSPENPTASQLNDRAVRSASVAPAIASAFFVRTAALAARVAPRLRELHTPTCETLANVSTRLQPGQVEALTIVEAGPFVEEVLALCLAPQAASLTRLSLGCSPHFLALPNKSADQLRHELWQLLASTSLLPNLRQLRLRGLPAPLGPPFAAALAHGLLRHRLTHLDLRNVDSLPTEHCLSSLTALQHLTLLFLNLKTARLPHLPHATLLSLHTNADLATSPRRSLQHCSSLRSLVLDRGTAHVATDKVRDALVLALWPCLRSLVHLCLVGFHFLTPAALWPLSRRRVPVTIVLTNCPRIEHAVQPS